MAATNRWNTEAATPGSRAAAEARLAELRLALRAALADKKARMMDFVESCKADRRAIREQVRAMRARSTRDLRDQVQVARGAAKLTRLTRLAEVRQATSAVVNRARALAAVERQHQAELARIAQTERSRHVEIRLAHERALAAADLRSAIFGKLSALFEREARTLRPGAGESRGEALLRFAERNPEKTHKAVEPHVHRKVDQARRAVADAEHRVRAVGGNLRAPASRLPREREALHTAGAPPNPHAASLPAAAPHPPAVALRAAPVHTTRAAPKNVERARGKRPEAATSKPAAASALPKATKAAPPPRAPKRRLGQIPEGGMLLKDFLVENAAVAAKKAARGKGRRASKAARVPAAPAPLPPAALAANANGSPDGAAHAARGTPFRSELADSVRPYKVRASCGHVVVRPMREATARVAYAPDVILEAPKGCACDACEAKKHYGANAPKPAPKREVKAPELKDTAEIAQRIRADVAEAVRKKELPEGKYSVRTSKYSMGSEISVVASALPFPMLNPDAFRLEKGSRHMEFERERFPTRHTPEAERVVAKLTAIVDAYHWDQSDLASDYHHARFHRDVRLDDELEWKRINAEKVAASRAASAGASPS